jgi:hypothetical protein
MAIHSTPAGIVVEHNVYTGPKTRENIKRTIRWESILGIAYNNDGGRSHGGDYYVLHTADNSPILTISSKERGNEIIRDYISNTKRITGDSLQLHDISRPTGKLLQIIVADPLNLDIIGLMLNEVFDKMKYRNIYTLIGAIIYFGFTVNSILSRAINLDELFWAILLGSLSIYLGYRWYQYDVTKAIAVYTDMLEKRSSTVE